MTPQAPMMAARDNDVRQRCSMRRPVGANRRRIISDLAAKFRSAISLPVTLRRPPKAGLEGRRPMHASFEARLAALAPQDDVSGLFMNQRAGAVIGEQFEQHGVRHLAVEDDDTLDAL